MAGLSVRSERDNVDVLCLTGVGIGEPVFESNIRYSGVLEFGSVLQSHARRGQSVVQVLFVRAH